MYSYIEYPENDKNTCGGYVTDTDKGIPLPPDLLSPDPDGWGIFLSDANIDVMSTIQRFINRCLSMFGPESNHKIRCNDQKYHLMSRWAAMLFERFEYKLTFDQTIWPPDEKGIYGNFVVIEVKVPFTNEYIICPIDFRENDHAFFHIDYINK